MPKAAAVGTISVVATEEHCAVLERTNGSYFTSQFKQLFYPSIINAPRNWVMPVQSVALLAEGSYNGGKCIRIRKILPTPLVTGGGNLGR